MFRTMKRLIALSLGMAFPVEAHLFVCDFERRESSINEKWEEKKAMVSNAYVKHNNLC